MSKDESDAQKRAFDRLKTELGRAFSTPEADYKRVSATDVIKRNRSRLAP
jgi:hypothetical protein